MSDRRYACSDCGQRQPEAGNCSACGEGPVLDLDAAGTIEILQQQDRTRADRRRSIALWVALPAGMVTGAVFAGLLPNVLAAIPLPIPFSLPIKVVVLMILVTLAIMQIILRAFPANLWFQDLEPESKSTRDLTLGMRAAPSRGTFIRVGLLIAAGAVVLGLGTVATTYGEQAAAEETAAAQATYATLEACLLGDDSMTGVDDRLRRVELGMESKNDDGWPGRCNEPAKALYDTLEGSESFGSLRITLGTQLGCDKGCDLVAARSQIAAFLSAARSAGLRAETDPNGTTPPVYDGSMLKADAFPPIGAKTLKLMDYTYLGDELVALMHEPGQSMFACKVDFGNGARSMSCESLFDARSPVAVSSGALLRDGSEVVVHGVTKASIRRDEAEAERPALRAPGSHRPSKRPPAPEVEVEKGAFRPDGSAIAVHFGEHDAMRNGLLIETKDKDHRVTRVTDGVAKSGFSLRGDDVAARPWAGGDYVAWVERAEGGMRLMQQEVGPTGAKSGAAEALGSIAGHVSRTLECRADGIHAVVLGDDAMTFLTKAGWSGPVHAGELEEVGSPREPRKPEAAVGSPGKRSGIAGLGDNPDPKSAREAALRDAAEFGMLGLLKGGGEGIDRGNAFGSGGLGESSGLGSGYSPQSTRRNTHRREVADPPKFTCGNGSATYTTHSVAGRSVVVTQLRCTASGCTRKQARLGELPIKQMWMVADLGSSIAVVWRAPSGALRMRVAPIDRLSATADSIVFDDAEYGGPRTGSQQYFVHGDTAVILFVGEGLHGLRIGADGKAVPLLG